MVGRPYWRSGSGRENLTEVRKWSENTFGCPELFGTLSRRSGSSRETLPVVWKWLGDPPRGPEVVGTPSRRCGSGRETIPEVLIWSVHPPGCPELVETPFPNVRKWSEDSLGGLELVGTPSQTSRIGRDTLSEV